MKSTLGVEDEPSENIIKRYKDLGENKPDTLESQLKAIKEIGFSEVDCFILSFMLKVNRRLILSGYEPLAFYRIRNGVASVWKMKTNFEPKEIVQL
ncbi:MAG: hypothetical protein H6Q92_239 [Nitrospirae bacterium]|jgi:endonuclease III-like uncharacterized protein|nr:hypothetical protein [Nitrospirota bacterium]